MSDDPGTTSLRTSLARLERFMERNGLGAYGEMLPETAEPVQGALLPDAQAHDWLTWLWERRIPPKVRAAGLDDLDDVIGRDVEAWAAGDDARNLVLLGPVGTGKTWAAVAGAWRWCWHRRARLRFPGVRGAPVVFAPVVELLDDMRPGGADVLGREAVRASLLILDDVGAERATEWAAERLYGIVNRRWLDELPTIATTNVPAGQVADVLGDRVLSRLAGGAMTLRLTGQDRRRT